MATIDEIRRGRMEKLKRIRVAGFSPYPGEVRRTHSIKEALENFVSLSESKEEIILTGRIRTKRTHGKATFVDMEDGSGLLQIFLREDGLGEKSYAFFMDNFDIGDFIQARGTLFLTKKREKTLDVADFRILSKSLLPLPEKWHGLKDEEERFRKRYLDLIFNKGVKENFKKKAKITQAIRDFLNAEGFTEVETSVLQLIYGGADAKPFKTRINAFDLEVFLRIALELDLKRLIVGGFEKVYEIGRVFRNEGVGRMHNPDFTMLEFYWAYADYKDLMKLTEKMFQSLLQNVFGGLKISYEGKEIDFTLPWPRIEYDAFIRKNTGLDIGGLNRDALFSEAQKLNVPVGSADSKAKIVDEIYKKHCRPKIWSPTFIIHHPAGSKPLAKPLENDPSKLASFQLVLGGGWELVNAYTELNDPIMQKEAFEEQERYFEEGMADAQRLDTDFIEALEYGMPPTAGFGMGIDRLAALLTDSHSLREIILFPTMKPRDANQ